MFVLAGKSCSVIKKKLQSKLKSKTKQFEKTEQKSEPDMTRMLTLSDQEFKTAETNVLRALTDTETIQEQISVEMEILRKNEKEMLELKKKS